MLGVAITSTLLWVSPIADAAVTAPDVLVKTGVRDKRGTTLPMSLTVTGPDGVSAPLACDMLVDHARDIQEVVFDIAVAAARRLHQASLRIGEATHRRGRRWITARGGERQVRELMIGVAEYDLNFREMIQSGEGSGS